MKLDLLDEKLDEFTANLGAAKAEILAKIEELKAALGELPPDAAAALDRLEAAVNEQLDIVQQEPEPEPTA